MQDDTVNNDSTQQLYNLITNPQLRQTLNLWLNAQNENLTPDRERVIQTLGPEILDSSCLFIQKPKGQFRISRPGRYINQLFGYECFGLPATSLFEITVQEKINSILQKSARHPSYNFLTLQYQNQPLSKLLLLPMVSTTPLNICFLASFTNAAQFSSEYGRLYATSQTTLPLNNVNEPSEHIQNTKNNHDVRLKPHLKLVSNQ